MNPQEHARLEDWAKNYAVLALMGFLSFLLILGKVVHYLLLYRGVVCRVIVIPAAVVSGIIGLIWLTLMTRLDPIMTTDLIQGLNALKVNLVNFVFAAFALGLFCGRSSSQHLNIKGVITSIVHEGMPMVIYSQILIWGQSSVCLLLTCILNASGIAPPRLFAAMVPLGVEAGTDVVPTAVYDNYWSQTVVQEAESLGLLASCVLGVIAISVKHYYVPSSMSRSGRHELYSKSSAEEFEAFGTGRGSNSKPSYAHSLPDAPGTASSPSSPMLSSAPPPTALALALASHHLSPFFIADDPASPSALVDPVRGDVLLAPASPSAPASMPSSLQQMHAPMSSRKREDKSDHQSQSSLGTHLSLIFLCVFVAFNIGLALRIIESKFVWLQAHRILSGIRMFEISIVCSVVLIHGLLTQTQLRFKSEWFMRLCGLMLDMLVIAAISTATPKPSNLEQVNYGMVGVYVLACSMWNVLVFVVFARNMFPNFWFERGVTLTADALGHCFMGLLFARSMDPVMQTPVPVAFASRLMLFVVPSSGGKNTIVVSLVDSHGSLVALVVCVAVVSAWTYIFQKFFKRRFVYDFLLDGNAKHKRRPDSLGGGHEDQSRAVLEMEDVVFGSRESSVYEDLEEISAEEEMYGSKAGGGDGQGAGGSGRSNSPAVAGTDIEMPKLGRGRSSSRAPLSTDMLLPPQVPSYTSICTNDISGIMNMSQFQTLAHWLPDSHSCKKFVLKYSLRRDGALLESLVSACSLQRSAGSGYSACIIVVEDSWGYIFGGYVGHVVQNSHHYYGSGQNFVFTLAPAPQVFRWTGSNDLFVVSNFEHLAMGGGGEGFAFQLDDELNTGISNRSATYNNPCLASNEFFKCLNVEVWTLEARTFASNESRY